MGEKGPVRILCDEIGFDFDRRLERDDLFIAFVAELVNEISEKRHTEEAVSAFGGEKPSDSSREVLDLARSLVARDPGLSQRARLEIAEAIHERSHEVNPDDPTASCDHLVDMMASCASAIRFGLEKPCRSRHAAEAAQHVWQHVYGVTRFDGNTPAWQREWARKKLASAILSLLPTTTQEGPKP